MGKVHSIIDRKTLQLPDEARNKPQLHLSESCQFTTAHFPFFVGLKIIRKQILPIFVLELTNYFSANDSNRILRHSQQDLVKPDWNLQAIVSNNDKQRDMKAPTWGKITQLVCHDVGATWARFFASYVASKSHPP